MLEGIAGRIEESGAGVEEVPGAREPGTDKKEGNSRTEGAREATTGEILKRAVIIIIVA